MYGIKRLKEREKIIQFYQIEPNSKCIYCIFNIEVFYCNWCFIQEIKMVTIQYFELEK